MRNQPGYAIARARDRGASHATPWYTPRAGDTSDAASLALLHAAGGWIVDVDAWYDIPRGEIVLAPGMFLPPIYVGLRPVQDNFATLGSIVAHEFMHSVMLEDEQFGRRAHACARHGVERLSAYARLHMHGAAPRAAMAAKVLADAAARDGPTWRSHIDELAADVYGFDLAFQSMLAALDETLRGERSADQQADARHTVMPASCAFFRSYVQMWCNEVRSSPGSESSTHPDYELRAALPILAARPSVKRIFDRCFACSDSSHVSRIAELIRGANASSTACFPQGLP